MKAVVIIALSMICAAEIGVALDHPPGIPPLVAYAVAAFFVGLWVAVIAMVTDA